MRKYEPKDNVQAKSYYTDRYWVAPLVPIKKVETDKIFLEDVNLLSKEIKVKEAYIQLEQMIISINSKDSFKTIQFLKNKCKYTMCSELSAVDYLAKDNEFEVFYQLLIISKKKELELFVELSQKRQ